MELLVYALIILCQEFFIPIILGLFAVTALFFGIVGYFAKKKSLIWISGTVLALFIIGIVTFFILFPTEFPYVDLWVYGKTKEQIIEVYGEPEYNEYRELAYETKWMIMDMFYYVIEFDENGRAYRMHESPYVGPGG